MSSTEDFLSGRTLPVLAVAVKEFASRPERMAKSSAQVLVYATGKSYVALGNVEEL